MNEQNLKKILRRQKMKLLFEGILRAFLVAAMAALLGLFVLSLVYHIFAREMPVSHALLACLPIFLVVFAALFGLRYYPTDKRVARRVDERGLSERVSTMLEYRDVHTEAAEAQRRDTFARLEERSARTGFKLSLKEVLSFSVSLILVVSMLLVPYDLFALHSDSAPDEEEIRQEEMIDELIKKLHEVVDSYENSEEFKKELDDAIDELAKELKNSETALDKIAAATAAEKRNSSLFDTERKNSPDKSDMLKEEQKKLEELLERYKKDRLDEMRIKELIDKMHEVVEAHENGEELKNELNKTIEELEKDLKEHQNATDRKESLEKADQKNDSTFEKEKSEHPENEENLSQEQKELKELLDQAQEELVDKEEQRQEEIAKDLIQKLREVVEKYENEEDFEEKLNSKIDDLEKAFEEAKTTFERLDSINEMIGSNREDFALERGEHPEKAEMLSDEEGEMEELLKSAAEKIGEGEENEGDKSGENGDPQPANGEQNDEKNSEGDDKQGEQDPSAGISHGSNVNLRTEPIYDSILGVVPYSEVFDQYYYEYNEAKSNGVFSDEEKKLLDAYFEALN